MCHIMGYLVQVISVLFCQVEGRGCTHILAEVFKLLHFLLQLIWGLCIIALLVHVPIFVFLQEGVLAEVCGCQWHFSINGDLSA